MKIIVYHDDLKIEWKGFKKGEGKKKIGEYTRKTQKIIGNVKRKKSTMIAKKIYIISWFYFSFFYSFFFYIQIYVLSY